MPNWLILFSHYIFFDKIKRLQLRELSGHTHFGGHGDNDLQI